MRKQAWWQQPRNQAIGGAALTIMVLLALQAGPGRNDPGGDLASPSIRIVPDEPRTFHELRAEGTPLRASVPSGAAGSSETGPRYEWKVNDVLAGEGPALTADHFRRGDLVELRVTQASEFGQAEELGYDSVTILNSEPTIRAVVFNRSRHDGGMLEATVNVQDPDNDPLEFEYEWRLDGKRFAGAIKNQAPVHDLEKGQSVELTVVARDPESKSIPFQSKPYVIDNVAPRLEIDAEARMRPQPNGERLVVFGMRISDADGDPLTVDFIGGPPNLEWNEEASEVTWQAPSDAELLNVLVRVSDDKGSSVERDLRMQFPGASSK